MRASPKDVRRDMVEFVCAVERELRESNPTLAEWAVVKRLLRLCELNNALHALAEAACNYGLTERQEKRQAKLEEEVRQIVKTFGTGFGVIFNGDPRGITVRLVLPSGRTNAWQGVGCPQDGGWRVPLTR
jgi:hypothetical protein